MLHGKPRTSRHYCWSVVEELSEELEVLRYGRKGWREAHPAAPPSVDPRWCWRLIGSMDNCCWMLKLLLLGLRLLL